MRILIAEDDVANAKFLSKYLSKFGEVVITPDGIAAVDEFVKHLEKGENFELVCLDIMMPKIDGYKVLASIRNAERKHGVSRMLRSKVIMTSALDETSFDSNQASDDYDEYICKPIDIMKLNDMFLSNYFVQIFRAHSLCQWRIIILLILSHIIKQIHLSVLNYIQFLKNKLLYRAIKADKLGSLIFYGPPGTGKTTLAMVIAHTTKADFKQINATTSGKKDMEQIIEEAKNTKAMYGRRTILFIDEIHRFNKSQQDYLLPFVEDGTIILIGATTENPYFEVNGALISRSNIFELKPLSKENIKDIILKAVYDQKGMGAFNVCIDDDAVEFLSDMSEGDARSALNAVELGVLSSEPAADGRIHITLAVAEECIQRRALRYDKDGDNHYDIISAFIKSMRGSDPSLSYRSARR